jgi:hypothetical protein
VDCPRHLVSFDTGVVACTLRGCARRSRLLAVGSAARHTADEPPPRSESSCLRSMAKAVAAVRLKAPYFLERNETLSRRANHITTHPECPAPPNGMLITCLLGWTFDRLTVPPTLRSGPRIESHRAARTDASGLVNTGTASRPD